MKILIVDDQRTQSLGLSAMLKQLGHNDLLIASSAEEAYEILRLNSLDAEPVRCAVDMILMDINMPGVSGIEACASIKANLIWRDIPVIMVTTSAELKDLADAFNAGAMDYIQKPPVEDELSVRVNSALRLKYEMDERKKREYDLEVERGRSEKLLLNILPAPIATRLKAGEKIIADQFDEVTVMFVDIANFTPLASLMPPAELVNMLNRVFSLFDSIIGKHGLEKIKTMGDAYMAVGGLPLPKSDHAEAVVNAALEILDQFPKVIDPYLQLRIGIHTGPVIAGVIGTNKFNYDLWGDTVNIASRMQSHGRPNTIQVTAKTHECLQGKYAFQLWGEKEIKGKGAMPVYVLSGERADSYSTYDLHAKIALSDIVQ